MLVVMPLSLQGQGPNNCVQLSKISEAGWLAGWLARVGCYFTWGKHRFPHVKPLRRLLEVDDQGWVLFHMGEALVSPCETTSKATGGLGALARLKSWNQSPLETSSRILGPEKLQDLMLAGWAGLLDGWVGCYLTW